MALPWLCHEMNFAKFKIHATKGINLAIFYDTHKRATKSNCILSNPRRAMDLKSIQSGEGEFHDSQTRAIVSDHLDAFIGVNASRDFLYFILD